MNWKVGDKFTLINTVLSALPINFIGFKGTVVSLHSKGGPYSQVERVTCEFPETIHSTRVWNVHPKEMRPLTKLELLLYT